MNASRTLLVAVGRARAVIVSKHKKGRVKME